MPRDLAELVRGLNSGALQIFRRQLSALPERDRAKTFSRLSGIPELADIVGGPAPVRQPTQQPAQQREQPRTLTTEQEIPLWQRALSTATAPFRWIEQNITQPFGAVVTSPFTPSTPETANLPWFQRELAEYKAWDDPNWGFLGVKGAVEMLPWLALPSAAGIAGRLGTVAARGGALGRAAGVAGQALRPTVAAERAIAYPISKPLELLAKGAMPSKVWRQLLEPERVALVKSAGLSEGVASKIWGGMTKAEKRALSERIMRPVGEVPVSTGRVYGVEAPSDIAAREFWDTNLEYNALRTAVERTPAAAFVARKLENAGDILREMGKTHSDMGYISEKISKIAREIDVSDWRGVLSKVEKEQLEVIRNQIAKIPEGTEVTTSIKKLLSSIAERSNKLVKTNLDDVERLIRKIPELPKPPPPPTIPQTATAAVPEGFNPGQKAAISKLTGLVKETKPITKETLALRRPEQAARISEYERLLQQNRAQGLSVEEADNLAVKALSGKYPEAEVTETLNVIRKGMTEDEVNTLFNIVGDAKYASSFTRRNTIEALQDLLLTNRLQQNQIRLLEETFGSDLAKELLKKRPWGVKAKELTVEILNAPRALLASADISGLLRQGGILSARHPIEAVKTVKPMLRAMFSDDYTGLMDNIIRTRVGMDELLNPLLAHPLEITAIPTKIAARITEREEAFASQIMNKIFFIKASNRAYVTVLNDIRSRSALNVLNSWKKAGIKYNKGDLSDLNQLINWASGRGTLPFGLGKQGGLLNAMLFSPKLIMSRLQFPTAILPGVTKSKLVRQEAWRTLLSFVGAGAGILTMAKMSGASDIELDPRSADFGKIKVGNVRLDIWTGYLQYIRFLAQFASAQRKATKSGRVYGLNRKEVIDRFVQTKLSPGVGLINDILKGETYLGESLPPKSAKSVVGQAYQRMMPLAIQDLIDGVNQDGPLGGIVSSAGLLGIGVVTYADDVLKERDKAAQQQYGMTWEEVGFQFGRAAQLRLEQETPAILEAEQEQEERFATGSPTTMGQWHNEGQAIEDTYRKAIKLAAAEFRQIRDGSLFKDKVDNASSFRRMAYTSRAGRKEYQDIIAYYNQPLSQEKVAEMNPGDVLRRKFYQQMFSPDMYDEFGNYRFGEAERREQEFLRTEGQQALDYIEEYRGSRWLDKPDELKLLEQAREILSPYWKIYDAVWSMYPPELEELSRQIQILEDTDPLRAKQALRQYPQILRARELIATYKKQMRTTNPMIAQAFNLFYR